MAINYVDYEVLAKGQTTYSNKAEELDGILKDLFNMNAELSDGWKNDTARAFVQRFQDDHKPAIEKVIAALNEISNYISTYSANRQDEDAQGASAVSG